MASAMMPNAGATRSGKARFRGRRWLGLGLLVAVAAMLIAAWRVFLGANFHTVEEGKLYRGAQQSAAKLEKLVADYGIRTVVNFRGCCDDMEWYRRQCRVVQRLGISQVDVVLSSARLPAPAEVRELVEVFDHAEPPLFLHCYRGADRTGLACAIYFLLKPDTSFAEARRQLGLRYGHVAVGRPGVLDSFFDLYQDWLSERNYDHTPDVFRSWLVDEYSGGRKCCFEDFTCQTSERRVGQPLCYHVRIRNLGHDAWKLGPGLTSATQLGFVLYDEHDHLVHRGRWGLREGRVLPGETLDVSLVVPSVSLPGRYRLFVDLMDQEDGWFFQTGSEPREEELVLE